MKYKSDQMELAAEVLDRESDRKRSDTSGPHFPKASFLQDSEKKI